MSNSYSDAQAALTGTDPWAVIEADLAAAYKVLCPAAVAATSPGQEGRAPLPLIQDLFASRPPGQ